MGHCRHEQLISRCQKQPVDPHGDEQRVELLRPEERHVGGQINNRWTSYRPPGKWQFAVPYVLGLERHPHVEVGTDPLDALDVVPGFEVPAHGGFGLRADAVLNSLNLHERL